MGPHVMATRVPCAVCKFDFRTQSCRIDGGKWVILCASCRAAIVKLHDWQRVNRNLAVADLVRVYAQCAPTPSTAAAAPPKKPAA